jgi:hypothetical protein
VESGSKSLVIGVAVIGLIGTLGAAVISNWDKLVNHATPTPSVSTGSASGGPAAPTIVAPHAPPIEVSTSETTVWGEDTKLITLEPGASTTLDARNLYAEIDTYPVSGCAGPAYIIYTWQVRDPYPEGGDLEIRSIVQGGSTDQVGLGAMGRATMGPCSEHIFKNNGLQTLRVEVRYATAINKKI